MKVVILCGGLTGEAPTGADKFYGPMVDIGGKPLIWHAMKSYAHYGMNNFILCLGEKGDVIRDYFLHYETINRDFTINLGGSASIQYKSFHKEGGWSITLVDTGLKVMSGARIKRIEEYLDGDTFIVAYGNRLSTIDVNRLLTFHQQQNKIGTITGVRAPERYSKAVTEERSITEFIQYQTSRHYYINGGIYVFNRKMFDYLSDDEMCTLEQTPLERLIQDNELSLYVYDGFWQQVDSHRQVEQLRSNAHLLGLPRQRRRRPVIKFS